MTEKKYLAIDTPKGGFCDDGNIDWVLILEDMTMTVVLTLRGFKGRHSR